MLARYPTWRRSINSIYPKFIAINPKLKIYANTNHHFCTMNNGDTSQATKRQKLSGPLIGTHNGHFHADEALAVYLLRLLPLYADSPLVRTRDSSILSKCHTVVDVGGEYDSSRNRFDHHQRGFEVTMPGHSTKLSSAGLVYMHYGLSVIAQCTGLAEDSKDAKLLFDKLYEDFIEAFDANDNGISVYDARKLKEAGLQKRYNDRGYGIGAVVNRFNYHDKAEDTKTAEQLQEEEDQRFLRASAFTGEQFTMELRDKSSAWLPARAVVLQAYSDRFQHDSSGHVLVIPYRQTGVPWQDHLYALECSETSTDPETEVLYVLFPESGQPDSKWRIRTVPAEPGSFESRRSLPSNWCGLRDKELSQVAGVDGCIFAHATGFIGGNETFQGALEMAKKALAVAN